MPYFQDTISQYQPTLRDRLGSLLSGDSKQGDLRSHLVQSLIGSTGVQGNGTGLLDFTPAGIPLNAYQAGRSGAEGNIPDSLMSSLAAMPMIPGFLGRFLGKSAHEASTLAGWPSKPYSAETASKYGFPKGPGLPTEPSGGMSRRGFLGAAATAPIAATIAAHEIPRAVSSAIPAAEKVATQQSPTLAYGFSKSGRGDTIKMALGKVGELLGIKGPLPDRIRVTNPVKVGKEMEDDFTHNLTIEGLNKKEEARLRKYGLVWDNRSNELTKMESLVSGKGWSKDGDFYTHPDLEEGHGLSIDDHGRWIHGNNDDYKTYKNGTGMDSLQKYLEDFKNRKGIK